MFTDEDWIDEEISNIGWDGVQEDIENILDIYNIGDVVEILADYCISGYWSHGYDGDEYDTESCLENVKDNRLRDCEIERFCGEFTKDSDGFIRFKGEDHSLNHNEEVPVKKKRKKKAK